MLSPSFEAHVAKVLLSHNHYTARTLMCKKPPDAGAISATAIRVLSIVHPMLAAHWAVMRMAQLSNASSSQRGQALQLALAEYCLGH